MGSVGDPDGPARDLAAPNRGSHGIRTSFELRRVNLATELAEATGQAFRHVPHLNVQWAPDGSPFVFGNIIVGR